jgi:hypothetical protein
MGQVRCARSADRERLIQLLEVVVLSGFECPWVCARSTTTNTETKASYVAHEVRRRCRWFLIGSQRPARAPPPGNEGGRCDLTRLRALPCRTSALRSPPFEVGAAALFKDRDESSQERRLRPHESRDLALDS